MSAISRFLGDSPVRIVLKLVVLSLIVGFVMSAFHWTPWDIYFALRNSVLRIWDMGFAAIENFLGYILLGAVIVLPAFIILRVLNYRR